MTYVLVEKPRRHVSLITMNRPERMNAMSFDTGVPLFEALRTVAADNDTWVAVLTGAGHGFCAGLDLEDHGAPPGVDGLPRSRIAIRAMEFMSDLVPTHARDAAAAAAINGPAHGGGMPAARRRRPLASESATSRAAGISNGLTGTERGGSFLLPRLIGASRAFEMILSRREIGAVEAEVRGLIPTVNRPRLLPSEQHSGHARAALAADGVAHGGRQCAFCW